jgi:hypothetical protein
MARIANSLGVLREQVDEAYPNRRKGDDGWIASPQHHLQNPNSDHEPNAAGVVTALDLTHDPANGFDSYAFADSLKANRDPRIKYLISDRRISNPSILNGAWRHYNGSDPHTGHIHISVSANPSLYDDPAAWTLSTIDPHADPGEPQAYPGEPQAQKSGKGSWYSQYSGKYNWVDRGDAPGSNALGVPDSAQGCAFYNRSTLGDWFVVTAPNGISLLMPQTDIGPNPNTGRKIDISSHMAEAFGYTPRNFPTDGTFKWVPAAAPEGLEGLTPKQQAIQWAKDVRAGHFPPPKPGGTGDTPIKPLPKDNLLMFILMLIMLSKEKLMADSGKALLPLLLQSALTGTQIDNPDLLSAILTGKPSASAANTPALTGAQHPTDINVLLAPLLYQALTGKSWPNATLPGTQMTPQRPAMSKPSVQLSVAGLGLSTILQALGIVGTPLGMGQDPTPIGTLATLVPIATAAIGATGGFGALANIAFKLFSGFGRQTT